MGSLCAGRSSFCAQKSAFVSAPSKNRSLQSPVARSSRGVSSHRRRPQPRLPWLAKDTGRPSSNWLFHCVIWFACTSNCCANSNSVFFTLSRLPKPLRLERSVWFRRGVCSFALLFQAIVGQIRREPPLIPVSQFSEHLSLTIWELILHATSLR